MKNERVVFGNIYTTVGVMMWEGAAKTGLS